VTRVLGVDACKTGWVAVALLDGRVAAVHVEKAFEKLVRDHSLCEVIAVDMPIGLPEGGQPRECDSPARAFIGKRGRGLSDEVCVVVVIDQRLAALAVETGAPEGRASLAASAGGGEGDLSP
jgi:predicted RNase H-like nuclease